MELFPAFEIGILNAWIFMIWLIILPFLSSFIIKEKEIPKTLRTSVAMKHEKSLNIISTGSISIGFIYSFFLPIKFNTIWFFIGFLTFFFGFIIDLTVLYILRDIKLDKPFMNGPYRYSRHPIYVASFLIILSISIMSLSWVFLLITIIVTLHQLISVPAEEKYCLKKYGRDYRDYMERTPRWIGIPKFRKKI